MKFIIFFTALLIPAFCFAQKARPVAVGIGNSITFFYPDGENIMAKGDINEKSKKVGKWIFFREDGSVIATTYFNKRGEKAGVWKYYDSKCCLYKKVIVKNNKSIIIEDNRERKVIEASKLKEPLELDMESGVHPQEPDDQ